MMRFLNKAKWALVEFLIGKAGVIYNMDLSTLAVQATHDDAEVRIINNGFISPDRLGVYAPGFYSDEFSNRWAAARAELKAARSGELGELPSWSDYPVRTGGNGQV